MKYRTRIYYTEEQKALMWDRWQAGDSLREIARLFDRRHSSVRGECLMGIAIDRVARKGNSL